LTSLKEHLGSFIRITFLGSNKSSDPKIVTLHSLQILWTKGWKGTISHVRLLVQGGVKTIAWWMGLRNYGPIFTHFPEFLETFKNL